MLNDIDNIKDRLEQIEKEKSYLIQEFNRLHYVDKDVSVLWKMYQRKLRTYKSMGYEIKPVDDSKDKGDLVAKYIGIRHNL